MPAGSVPLFLGGGMLTALMIQKVRDGTVIRTDRVPRERVWRMTEEPHNNLITLQRHTLATALRVMSISLYSNHTVSTYPAIQASSQRAKYTWPAPSNSIVDALPSQPHPFLSKEKSFHVVGEVVPGVWNTLPT